MDSPRLREIYQTERAAPALSFPTMPAVSEIPSRVVQAVKTFARAMPGGFSSGTTSVPSHRSRSRCRPAIFVEAGYIHYPLYSCLRSQMGTPQGSRGVPARSGRQATRRQAPQPRPGDVLTLLYTLPRQSERSLTDLLAARA